MYTLYASFLDAVVQLQHLNTLLLNLIVLMSARQLQQRLETQLLIGEACKLLNQGGAEVLDLQQGAQATKRLYQQ